MQAVALETNEVLATKRTDLMQVDPRNLIIEEGFNVRTDFGDIHGLAMSIVSNGLIEPLEGFKVRGEDKYIVTDGHRRHKALSLALELHAKGDEHFSDLSKIARVPMLPGSSDPLKRLLTMAITGEKKKNLTDLERAEMYSRLMKHFMDKGLKKGEAIKEICNSVGVSQPQVYNILSLNKLAPEIKEAISSGRISGSTVVAIVREIKDSEQQVAAINAAIEEAESQTEEGGKSKKATAKNVKGLKAKTPMIRIKEIVLRLRESGVDNVRAQALYDLVEGLEGKATTKSLVELFS